MSDNSLMNPDHLKSEISYLETFIVPKRTERVEELLSRISEAFKPFHVTKRRSDNTYVLSQAQVDAVLEALAGCEVDLHHTSGTEEFYLRKYKDLLTDRRWLIGSKLKFLKK